jgi:hypothetical protein
VGKHRIPCRNKNVKIDKKTAYFMRSAFKDIRKATAEDLEFVNEYAFGVSAGYMFAGGITLAQREKLLDIASYLYEKRKEELEI